MEQVSETTIRIIEFHENGLWVAQCLEYDIGAQAPDIDTLNARLEAVLREECEESMRQHNSPFAGIDPAPERYLLMWERRARSIDVSPAAWMSRLDRKVNINMALVA